MVKDIELWQLRQGTVGVPRSFQKLNYIGKSIKAGVEDREAAPPSTSVSTREGLERTTNIEMSR